MSSPPDEKPTIYDPDYTSSLPGEVLSRIFALVQTIMPIPPPWKRPTDVKAGSHRSGKERLADMVALRQKVDQYRCQRLAWIAAITHVCGRWRAVAIADCGLWSCPSVHLGSKALEETLRRCRDAPLSIDAEQCGYIRPSYRPVNEFGLKIEQSPFFVDFLSSHVRCIRIIKIKCDTQTISSILLRAYGRLEEMECSVERDDDLAYDRKTLDSGGTIQLFDGNAPRLRSLKLSHWCWRYDQLPTNPSMWKGITYLRLNLRGNLLSRGSDSPILIALERAPYLQTLRLELPCGFDHRQEEPPLDCQHCTTNDFDPVILSRSLEHFGLRGCTSTMAHFVTHIRLPTHTKIYLDSLSRGTSDESALSYIRRGIGFDRIHAPSAHTVAITGDQQGVRQSRLYVSRTNTTSLYFHPWLMSSDPGNKDHVETMDIDLSLILAHESLSKLAHCVTGARALTLAHDGHGLAEREYVTQFTLLRHLTLSGVTLASITSLLEPQSDSSSGLLFPSLQSISIGGCVVWDLISTSPQSPGTGVLRLRRALQSRAGRGYPVNPVLVHIKEELEFIQREDWERTSCSKYLHNVGTIVRERLEDLHAIEGLRIVPYKSAYILDDDGQTGRLVEWFV